MIVAESESAAVMGFDRERLGRSGCTFLAALHACDFQRVIPRLEARDIDAPLGTVVADKGRIDLHVGFACTAIVHVIAVGTVRSPFRIGRFEPAALIDQMDLCMDHSKRKRGTHHHEKTLEIHKHPFFQLFSK